MHVILFFSETTAVQNWMGFILCTVRAHAHVIYPRDPVTAQTEILLLRLNPRGQDTDE